MKIAQLSPSYIVKNPPCILLFSLILFGTIFNIEAQSTTYTSFFTGDTTDVSPQNYLSGIVLAGGATDNDDAMRWMLERADGGDVLILRASGSDGYNDYFYQELGINVNSVETIRFESAAASSNAYVLQQIANAEVIFFAGGDQYDYYQYWKDTPVETAINAHINEKQATIGGTSAGMAILSKCYYTPSGGSLDSDEALSNPFHPDFDIIGKDDFLDVPFTQNTITDTHFDNRDRAGRSVAFLARLTAEYEERFYAIACNEYTAITIDEAGIAHAFGDFENYPDEIVYFLQTNCQDTIQAEVLEANTPLTWYRLGSAVKAYRLPAYPEGLNTFDLNDWQTGEGGSYEDWYVQNGELVQVPDASSDCSETLFSGINLVEKHFQVTPNPFNNEVRIEGTVAFNKLLIVNSLGQIIFQEKNNSSLFSYTISTTDFPLGYYQLLLENERGIEVHSLVKTTPK